VITKKIAKHGNQAIIVIPRMLEQHIRPGMIAQLTIDLVEDAECVENIGEVKLSGGEK
jgi:hypothetical protein